MTDNRTFAVIRSPKVSGKGKVVVLYKTHTNSPKKAARRYARHICNIRAKKSQSAWCKYKVHVLDMSKLEIHGVKPLVRVYDVTTQKFERVRKVDIGSMVIPVKAKRTVRFVESLRLSESASYSMSSSPI